ncbi:MAG TPA: dual specificity protein phosphatase [Candidatus Methylomirabilis sp.]|nr:dual specificity protein phosphatase [Candidatus Methylomirabilis sp.]
MSWFWTGEERSNGNGIDFLTEDLAVANLEAASDLEALTRHGIRAVVDASIRDGNPRYPGILYHDVPIADPDERLSEFLPGVVAFIDEARKLGPVLLHCVAGISRSPALAICYLHERHGMSLLTALDHIRSRRPVVDPHPLFLRVIQEYYLERRLTPPGQLDLFAQRWRRWFGGDGQEER